ncbi:MarR family winged helix-turn-helix transcriptional regulator [Aurantiacibacter poecillastricola]|uniref:MarR family winged helix-turn-helix transcriptional regulator n=1 Tax=Aurantiacibacter poecillastricola TaxID=3064385 RepID=UPI00273F9C00|nr:MarR family winged helix-turn-helix transcriptional regulator [Aurantiacibacter sp. 219JJ12-13]MDP5261422.1 MarR family winged helix-turn-helix transcriptional regulator [Aurantiacibacter sp. 219JJ12-13]
MDDPLIRFPGYSLRRAANVAGAELAGRLAQLDLRQSEASALLLIAENPEITASALGRKLDIQRANMVPLLKRLDDAGLIERHAIDGKSQGLMLTAQGDTMRGKALDVIEQFEVELIARVPAEHRSHLLPALNALWQGDGTD